MSFNIPFVKRYIAGRTRSDAIETAIKLQADGIHASIDHLGENVTSIGQAEEAAAEYLALLDDIKRSGLKSNVSLKLTHLGLDISLKAVFENTLSIARKAAEYGLAIRIDMEGSAYTERIVDIALKLQEQSSNIGVAIQSYLKRSQADIARLNDSGVSVRLVKGAYLEPPEIAFANKSDVDANFSELMKALLKNGTHPAIATHDEKLIEETIRFAEENYIPKDGFDFEMLLGIKRSLQKELAARGYTIRVYVPYGKDWMAYTMRRFRERKENIYFVLNNLFD